MKKILALILAMVLVLSLGACGAKEEAPATEAPAAEAAEEAAEEVAEEPAVEVVVEENEPVAEEADFAE